MRSGRRCLRYLAQIAIHENKIVLTNAIMTSLMIVCYVITMRYWRYFFPGNVMVALAWLAFSCFNCIKQFTTNVQIVALLNSLAKK